MNRIPLNIHFIFLSKKERYPDLFEECIIRVKHLHPCWKIKIYNEEDADFIIRHYLPGLYRWFFSYGYNVQKADIFRVILIYLFGGFYLDMDMYCLKELDSLCQHKLVLSVEKVLSDHEVRSLGLRNRIRIANYMFGSAALHPFWLQFLISAVKESQRSIVCDNDILESTGPGLLTDFYHNRNLDEKITLLENPNLTCMRLGHNERSCYFGEFAAHLHQGTWRFENRKRETGRKLDRNFTTWSDSDIDATVTYLKRLLSDSDDKKIYNS